MPAGVSKGKECMEIGVEWDTQGDLYMDSNHPLVNIPIKETNTNGVLQEIGNSSDNGSRTGRLTRGGRK